MALPILFTIPNFKTAGSGREMVQIIRGLGRRKFEPWIGVNEAGGPLYEELKGEGYRLLCRQFSSPSSTSMGHRLRDAYSLGQFLKSEGVRLWQSFDWSSDFSEALAARLGGIPYVYTKKNMNWGRKAWKVKTWLATAVVARNRDMKTRFFDNSSTRKKAHWITGGVAPPPQGIHPPGYFRSLFRHPDRPLVVCLAQLVRSKDQETLIRALENSEDLNLMLAGAHLDLAYRDQLRRRIRESNMEDRVWMEGSVSAVGDLLADADLFVLPTGTYGGHEEGCPVALMEAMSMGLPCVGSDVAGIRDLIRPQETGWLFRPHHPEDLRRQILDILSRESEARQIGEKAREHIAAHHGLDKEARAFASLYSRILKKTA